MDTRSPRPLILTTDCGTEVDDQWALAHLAVSPELDLLGVVTTHAPNLAPPPAETSAGVVRNVLGHLRLASTPPVFAGSSVPLTDRKTSLMNAGVEFILEQSRSFSPQNRLAVLAIGAATDVASVILADPTAAERIQVVAMGFQGWEAGGDEWNVKNDPKAWQVILESGVEIVIGGAHVAVRDLRMSVSRACELFGDCGEPAEYLNGILAGWLATYSGLAERVTGSSRTWPMWDSITVAYLLGCAEYEAMPRPVLCDDLSFAPNKDSSVISWITGVDSETLWKDFARKLG